MHPKFTQVDLAFGELGRGGVGQGWETGETDPQEGGGRKSLVWHLALEKFQDSAFVQL